MKVQNIRQRRERNGEETFHPLRGFISLRFVPDQSPKSETDEAPERAKRFSTIPCNMKLKLAPHSKLLLVKKFFSDASFFFHD